MNATMTDVAKAAGVSIATVGRVIHQNGYVSPEAREKIQKAIDTLGYVPNQMARSLKQSRSGIIGCLVLPSPNGLYQRINLSVREAAMEQGYQLLTMESHHDPETDVQLIHSMIGLRVEGLIIISHTNIPDDAFIALERARIPVAAIERGYTERGIDSLLVEDFAASYDAVRRIAEAGHKRVGLIASRVSHSVECQRLQGYRQAVRDCKLDDEEGLIRLCDSYTAACGREAMEQLLALPEPPTAVFTTADYLAAGGMQALYDHRIRIPEEMSIVGYDNVLSRSLSPPINSVDLALEDIGQNVLRLLTERMQQKNCPPQVCPIHTHYIDRGTVRQK